jgi:putative transposase
MSATKYLAGNYYHIYNRGSRKDDIFFSDENYDYLLRLLYLNSHQYSVSIIAYCLMPNHYHFLLFQKESGSISKVLQTTMNSYVQGMNAQFHLSGSLFEGKAKNKLIDSDQYAVQVVRYIHLNPVKAKLVNKPEKWKHSDYSRWIDNAENKIIDSSEWVSLRNSYFGSGKNYQSFVEDYKDEMVDISRYVFDD